MGRQLGVVVVNGCLGLLQVLAKVVSHDSQCDLVVIRHLLLLLREVRLCLCEFQPHLLRFLVGLLLLLYDFLAAIMLCIDQPGEISKYSEMKR